MKKVVVTIGMLVCVLYIPGFLLFLGGLLFGADMEPYALWLGIWGIYDIGFVLGLVSEEVLG